MSDIVGSIDSLKTENFGQAEIDARNLATRMSDLKADLNTCKNALLANWVGDGRASFEAYFYALTREFDDISEEMWDLFDSLCDAESAYIEADNDVATSIESALE